MEDAPDDEGRRMTAAGSRHRPPRRFRKQGPQGEVTATSVRFMRRVVVENKRVDAFGSTGVASAALARVGEVEGAAIDVLTFAPGGRLGRHPTRLWQLFSLVSGAGWASGSGGVEERLVPGDAVLWEPGEEHGSGTDEGMVAVVIQTPVPPLPGVV